MHLSSALADIGCTGVRSSRMQSETTYHQMSRERTIRRAVERELEKRHERERTEQTRTPLTRKVARLLGVLATLFGVYVGFLNLVPRITVTPQAALVSTDAFSAPFVVSNDGFLPIYDVHCFCSPRKVRYRKPGSRGGLEIVIEGADENETGGVEAPFVAKKLSPGQRATFPCPFPKPVSQLAGLSRHWLSGGLQCCPLASDSPTSNEPVQPVS